MSKTHVERDGNMKSVKRFFLRYSSDGCCVRCAQMCVFCERTRGTDGRPVFNG